MALLLMVIIKYNFDFRVLCFTASLLEGRILLYNNMHMILCLLGIIDRTAGRHIELVPLQVSLLFGVDVANVHVEGAGICLIVVLDFYE